MRGDAHSCQEGVLGGGQGRCEEGRGTLRADASFEGRAGSQEKSRGPQEASFWVCVSCFLLSPRSTPVSEKGVCGAVAVEPWPICAELTGGRQAHQHWSPGRLNSGLWSIWTDFGPTLSPALSLGSPSLSFLMVTYPWSEILLAGESNGPEHAKKFSSTIGEGRVWAGCLICSLRRILSGSGSRVPCEGTRSQCGSFLQGAAISHAHQCKVSVPVGEGARMLAG